MINYNKKSHSALRNIAADISRQANNRLRLLERKGLANSSNAYRWVLNQFGLENLFISLTSTGKIKFDRGFFKSMTKGELIDYINTVENFMQAKTSTVRGTEKKYEKAHKSFEKFLENQDFKNMTFDEYMDFWEDTIIKNYFKKYGSQETIERSQKYDYNMAIDVMETILETDKANDQLGFRPLTQLERIELFEKYAKKRE